MDDNVKKLVAVLMRGASSLVLFHRQCNISGDGAFACVGNMSEGKAGCCCACVDVCVCVCVRVRLGRSVGADVCERG